ncbi:uncharacterized protein LOC114661933 isoform X2 [Erpetoichthys calabaricus]|uniref:uncharacterized protein LOC114661933 isoform X2 n=1 Tax=Erpetoichthys calabaricus TaxID=27687 RepID=UPI002234EA2C|nr:uncharacterized protein LOC114661933 isoform X2 [Erpetoichthys calabaricus]
MMNTNSIMEKYLEQLVEMTKNKKEGDEQFQQQFLVKTERNSSLLDEMTKSQQEGTHQLQQLILEMVEMNKRQLAEMNKDQQEGTHQLQQLILEMVEMNKRQLAEMKKDQKEGTHQLQQLIQEMVEMNKKLQEETDHLKQQFFGMQDEQREILNVLDNLQHKMRPRVTVVPSVSTKPVEDSSASDSDTDGEETSEGGVAPANERRILPSRTVKSFTVKSSGIDKLGSQSWLHKRQKGTQKKVQDFLSEAIEKLFRENKLPIICKKTKGILNKNNLTKKGSRSVWSNGVWLFAVEFEILSGWKNSKNWKKSIYIDMEEVKKNSNGPCGQNNSRRIYLYDFFKQIKFFPASQQVDKLHIRKYQHLFQQ